MRGVVGFYSSNCQMFLELMCFFMRHLWLEIGTIIML